MHSLLHFPLVIRRPDGTSGHQIFRLELTTDAKWTAELSRSDFSTPIGVALR